MTNPGPNEAVVSLKVLTATSAFTPAGLPELQIPPESVGVFTLTDALAVAASDATKDKPKKDDKLDEKADEKAVAQEAPLGLLIESSQPVASSLRSVVGGDLSFSGRGCPDRTGSDRAAAGDFQGHGHARSSPTDRPPPPPRSGSWTRRALS